MRDTIKDAFREDRQAHLALVAVVRVVRVAEDGEAPRHRQEVDV